MGLLQKAKKSDGNQYEIHHYDTNDEIFQKESEKIKRAISKRKSTNKQ